MKYYVYHWCIFLHLDLNQEMEFARTHTHTIENEEENVRLATIQTELKEVATEWERERESK